MADQFKKDDYIVILRPKNPDSNYVKYGHCYKQRSDNDRFDTIKDSTGMGCSTNIPFYREEWWRYATPDEISEYERENNMVSCFSYSVGSNYCCSKICY